MSAIVVSLCARRGVSNAHRQLLNPRGIFRFSAGLSVDDRKSVAQNVSPWLLSVVESPPVIFAEQILTKFHEISGLPWWASIAISTMTLRVFFSLPIGIYSEITNAKLVKIGPELEAFKRRLSEEVAAIKHVHNHTEAEARTLYNRAVRRRLKILLVREDCHPYMCASVLLLYHVSVWISFSLGLQDLALSGAAGSFDYMAMRTEGLLWFENLTETDSTLILPVATAALNLTNIELLYLRSITPKSKQKKIIYNYGRVSCLAVIPMGLVFTSATSLFWLCNASAALGQNLLLMSPRFRRLVRIPITAKEDQTPYRTVWNKLQTRFLRRNNTST